MSELQTLKTLIHEIAHAKLHDIDLNAPLEDLENRPDRRTREVQAESIAYTVCQHYGLDTSDYSFGYVAGWSAGRELTELKSSLETIRSTAAEIINSIDEHIAELQKEQVQDAPREKAAMPEYIYKIEANPRTTGDNDRFFLQAYLPQENGRAKIGDVLYIGSLAKCRELMGGLNAGELTQGEVKELYAKAQEAEADKDTFSIYQLKQGDETRDFRFEPYNRLQAAGNVVDKANYELVYSAELTPGTSLEDIYTRFNIDHPKDFKGHSLSVSDVVVLHQNGQDAAHYVDSFGYKEVPEFLQEQTIPAGQYFNGSPDPQLGKFERFEALPNDPDALKWLLREEHRNREQLLPGDFKAHIATLHDGLIETEARRIVREMKRNDTPNSPNKTHFMVELSPAFMQLANTKDIDRLFSMLPYKTLSFSKIEGRHGTYALIDKGENRDKEIKKPRPSVRAQLKADKTKTAPKKTTTKAKNHDLEV